MQDLIAAHPKERERNEMKNNRLTAPTKTVSAAGSPRGRVLVLPFTRFIAQIAAGLKPLAMTTKCSPFRRFSKGRAVRFRKRKQSSRELLKPPTKTVAAAFYSLPPLLKRLLNALTRAVIASVGGAADRSTVVSRSRRQRLLVLFTLYRNGIAASLRSSQ